MSQGNNYINKNILRKEVGVQVLKLPKHDVLVAG
jgi:hypothetical protein